MILFRFFLLEFDLNNVNIDMYDSFGVISNLSNANNSNQKGLYEYHIQNFEPASIKEAIAVVRQIFNTDPVKVEFQGIVREIK